MAALAMCGGLSGCGDGFLETNIYNGIDIETGLDNVVNIGYALNGTYYRLQSYYFGGNYVYNFGDIASDISYWNTKTNHFNNIYNFAPTETDNYLYYIWNYGYKVADNSARIIKASNEIYSKATDTEKADLDLYMAEAYALRAYSQLYLVNIFAHQVKVDGKDYSAEPGIVIINEPIQAYSVVSRSTIGETYAAIEGDLAKSLEHYGKVGSDRGEINYFTLAAVYGLQARTYLYEEKWAEAAAAAEKAIAASGITTLAYTPDAYKKLYSGQWTNNESFFCLAIDQTDNYSANSSGTLWTTYNYSPSPYLQSMMANDDVRTSIWAEGDGSSPTQPVFNGGKLYYGGGNPAYATNYLINAPEMFLIQAEAYARLNQVDKSKEALLVVAKRNPAITSVADITGDLMTFIRDERARELFQEGLRLYDLRRWGQKANIIATGAPEIGWLSSDFNISDCVYPIPVDEINAGFGVTQNTNWRNTFPSM